MLVTVNNVNDAPEVNQSSLEKEINLDDIVEIDLYTIFTDVEGANLVFGFDEPNPRGFNPDEISATIEDNILTLRTVNNWYGVTIVNLSANDGEDENNIAYASLVVTINNVYTNPEISTDVTSLDFGTVFVGEISQIKSIDIDNISLESVNIDDLDSPANFQIRFAGDTEWSDAITAFTLEAETSRTIEIRFLPTEQEDYNVNLVINSNATNNSIIEVNLQGITRNPQPNAFTPNGDGKNDLFTVSLDGNSSGKVKMFIYNSRGKKIREISENSTSTISWDGKDDDNNKCKSSPYLYYIEKDGSRIMRGKVYLVR